MDPVTGRAWDRAAAEAELARIEDDTDPALAGDFATDIARHLRSALAELDALRERAEKAERTLAGKVFAIAADAMAWARSFSMDLDVPVRGPGDGWVECEPSEALRAVSALVDRLSEKDASRREAQAQLAAETARADVWKDNAYKLEAKLASARTGENHP